MGLARAVGIQTHNVLSQQLLESCPFNRSGTPVCKFGARPYIEGSRTLYLIGYSLMSILTPTQRLCLRRLYLKRFRAQ